MTDIDGPSEGNNPPSRRGPIIVLAGVGVTIAVLAVVGLLMREETPVLAEIDPHGYRACTALAEMLEADGEDRLELMLEAGQEALKAESGVIFRSAEPLGEGITDDATLNSFGTFDQEELAQACEDEGVDVD